MIPSIFFVTSSSSVPATGTSPQCQSDRNNRRRSDKLNKQPVQLMAARPVGLTVVGVNGVVSGGGDLSLVDLLAEESGSSSCEEWSAVLRRRDERRAELATRLADPFQLATEFAALPLRSSHLSAGSAERNPGRNRCPGQVLPYDVTRVRLEPTPDNPEGYITAAHLRVEAMRCGRPLGIWLIVAQSPSSNSGSVNEFWRMIWESGAAVIAGFGQQTGNNLPADHQSEMTTDQWCLRRQWSKRAVLGPNLTSRTPVSIADANEIAGAAREQICLELEHRASGQRRIVYYGRYAECDMESGVPASLPDFIDFVDDMMSLHQHLCGPPGSTTSSTPVPTSGPPPLLTRPLILSCPTGAGTSAMSALFLLARFMLEHGLDTPTPDLAAIQANPRSAHQIPSSAARRLAVSELLVSLRTNICAGLVTNAQQYAFVLRALLRYLDSTRLI